MGTNKDRIAAMLALARHPGTPRHEAETALAMASTLMQRHGWSESDVRPDHDGDRDESIVAEEVRVTGPYSAQRRQLLWGIALVHSCRGYSDRDAGGEMILVLWGRRDDLFAARTLFAAADAMGCRLLPGGDRSWRVSWWKGFRRGIEETLRVATSEFIAESPGAGLVLADRARRAEEHIRLHGPPLRGRYSYVDDSAMSYGAGLAAGRSFGAAGRSFTSGVRGELG